jgi:hypothetical protein
MIPDTAIREEARRVFLDYVETYLHSRMQYNPSMNYAQSAGMRMYQLQMSESDFVAFFRVAVQAGVDLAERAAEGVDEPLASRVAQAIEREREACATLVEEELRKREGTSAIFSLPKRIRHRGTLPKRYFDAP